MSLKSFPDPVRSVIRAITFDASRILELDRRNPFAICLTSGSCLVAATNS